MHISNLFKMLLFHCNTFQYEINCPKKCPEKMGEADQAVSTESVQNLSQKMVSSKIDVNITSNFFLVASRPRALSTREAARFASVSLQNAHAGDWLGVVPSPFNSDGPCPAYGQPSDRQGDS